MVNRIPEKREYAYRLALYKSVKAEILAEQKKGEESIQVARDAVTALEEMVGTLPVDAPVERKDYRVGLARAYDSLGYALAGGGKDDEGKETFGKAVELWKELALAYPEDKRIADRLAVSKRELEQFD